MICRQCAMLDALPSVSFDDGGLCSACRAKPARKEADLEPVARKIALELPALRIVS